MGEIQDFDSPNWNHPGIFLGAIALKKHKYVSLMTSNIENFQTLSLQHSMP